MNNAAIINLSIIQLFFAFLIPLVILLISKASHIGKERDILKTSIKMIVQLFILGYLLLFLLEKVPPYIGVLYIFVMLFFAIRTFKKRIEATSKVFLKTGTIAMILGSLISLSYFIIMVVSPTPLVDPQYIIPIYGMILGNTLTGITLGVNTFNETLKTEQNYINTLINLGANPNIAINKVVTKTIGVAITPTLTTMSAMGLVSLPGMMTGQILSGVDPMIAVKYQMAIMFGIFGSVFLSNFIFLFLTKKSLINKYGQLTFNQSTD